MCITLNVVVDEQNFFLYHKRAFGVNDFLGIFDGRKGYLGVRINPAFAFKNSAWFKAIEVLKYLAKFILGCFFETLNV